MQEKKVVDIKLNGKVIVASIIYHLFIERIMKNSKFIRGLECLFNGFLPVTGAVWESFAQKLDKAVEGVTVKFDEDMLKTYKESMGVKIKDYTEPTEEVDEEPEEILEEASEEKKEEVTITVPEELVNPVAKEIPKILEAVKEELTGEPTKVIEEGASDKIDEVVEIEDTLREKLHEELTALGVEKKEELDEEGKKILDGIQKKVSDTLENIDEVEKRSKEALKEIMEETENE